MPHLLEDLLALSVQGLVDSRHALRADDAGDWASDAFHRVLERILLAADLTKLSLTWIELEKPRSRRVQRGTPPKKESQI